MSVDSFIKELKGSEKYKKAARDGIKDIEERLRVHGLEIERVELSEPPSTKDTPHLNFTVSGPFAAFMDYAKARGFTDIAEEQYGQPTKWKYWFPDEQGARWYTSTVSAVRNEQSRIPGFTYVEQFDDV